MYREVWIPVNDAIFSDEIKELEALIHRAETNLLENIGIPVVNTVKGKPNGLSLTDYFSTVSNDSITTASLSGMLGAGSPGRLAKSATLFKTKLRFLYLRANN